MQMENHYHLMKRPRILSMLPKEDAVKSVLVMISSSLDARTEH